MSEREASRFMNITNTDEIKLSVAMSFHERRLRELAYYETCLENIVFSKRPINRKDELSYERLLKQPISYQVISLIWLASPYSSGKGNWDGLTCNDTVYSLAALLSSSDEQKASLINYVSRVIEASEFFSLVRRENGEGNKRLIKGSMLLHELMYQFALNSLAMDK